ncbi:MAG: TraR/DksA C4-type zinc finger protein [Myxococcales bacterium]|nr:TraR/DksA C4-type zinc finger protein [Myxococcales bacterium]
MEHLSKAQRETLHAKLERERVDLHQRSAGSTEVVADNPDTDPRDIEDAAAQEAGRFSAGQLLARDRARLAEVEAALARMQDGSYGICEETDEPIPFRRLELEPTTRYTVAALEALESEGGVADRHGDEPGAY